MEKLFQMKNNFIFKFLPKQPLASFSPQNPTLSPPRSPVSIIPKEARRRHRASRVSFSIKEPSSPKVSCIGQVQSKKKKKKTQKYNKGEMMNNKKSDSVLGAEKKASSLATVEAPSLGMMKKFASGRGNLGDVDFALA